MIYLTPFRPGWRLAPFVTTRLIYASIFFFLLQGLSFSVIKYMAHFCVCYVQVAGLSALVWQLWIRGFVVHLSVCFSFNLFICVFWILCNYNLIVHLHSVQSPYVYNQTFLSFVWILMVVCPVFLQVLHLSLWESIGEVYPSPELFWGQLHGFSLFCLCYCGVIPRMVHMPCCLTCLFRVVGPFFLWL